MAHEHHHSLTLEPTLEHDHDHHHSHDHHDHDHCCHDHEHHNHEHEHGHCLCHGHSHQHDDGGEKSGFLKAYAFECVSLLLLLAGLIMGYTGVFEIMASYIGVGASWLELGYYILALLPVGCPILKETVELWFHGDVMNEFTLMVLAAIGAFIIGEYPEGVAVLLFYSFGEKLQDTASDDVRRRIRNLVGRMPHSVTVVGADGDLQQAEPEKVEVGTVTVVKPGERVVIDGVLENDEPADLDTSAITGESVPRSYSKGQELSAGMIPVDRELRVRTTRAFADSTLSRMMKMIDEAAAGKTPTESMLRRITRWFTPTVVTLAVLVFVVPGIVALASRQAFDARMWLERALVFLVCGCPCALVVSIPLSYFAALGNAARRGLLFKGAKHIDTLREIDTVVFDKTGTVTTGSFKVSSVTGDAEVLAIAAAVDSESAHPLAIAVVAEARKRGLALPKVTGITTVAHGMRAVYADGQELLVGSRTLLESHGIAVKAEPSDMSEICVAKGGEYLGSIYLEDSVKPEAAEAVAALHSMGVTDVEIMSGDHHAAVVRAGAKIGADTVNAELLPEQKHELLAKLKKEGRRVAFVGDGINDAPSIAAADIGVAMGTLGSDMAVESADVVIAGDDLRKLGEGMKLSQLVRRVVMENVAFAFGIKGIVMILAAFGIATLWAGVFADTGVTLVTIIWTLWRLRVNLRASR